MYNFIILLSLFAKVICQDYYCNICENHVACNNNGRISEECASRSRLIDLSSLQDYIVSLHNTKRNTIALGMINKFYPASRMATMSWDNELAYLAELNVKSCNYKHDSCHNTERFLYSGQNIGIQWDNSINSQDAAVNIIENWFNEYNNVDMSIINSYPYTSKKIGHFTVMVADRNTKFGCAMLMTADTQKQYLFTCNYAISNVPGEKIYNSGVPGSQCTTGTNPYYPGLCSIYEDIDPNV